MTPKDLKTVAKRVIARSKLDKNGCLIWRGAKVGRGYGAIYANGKQHSVHRIMFEAYHGPLGDLCCCHTCDNPVCVNPDHLWAGTYGDNNKDRSDKGRSCKGEQRKNAKLRAEDVLSIRRRYKPYSRENRAAALAREFRVTDVAIIHVANRRNWAHI